VPEQLDFPSLKFPPGRTVLYLFEVAEKLGITEQHVADLIAEGKLQAINIAGKNCTARQFYRVPVEAYEAYIRQNLL
jgi:fibrillarin-like rRNA methylase